MQKEIELLAPAGSWEALEAAINAGANAVYLGGKAFGARAYANNFDEEELGRAVCFCHMHYVRIYVTVNTLVDNKEMADLEEYLIFLNNVGVDGIIVQDLGVIRIARRLVPELPLHASTQMTVTNSAGVRFAADKGIVRVVPARELSLDDLRKVSGEGVEIEAFIHGALCICYSGQCLMSSLIGGRSGNRGRCAQPCRLPYRLTDKEGQDLLADGEAGQYLLSPRDLNTLSILPQMIEAGVLSYKIEGRMKRPEYVAVVVDAYRRAMDSYLAGHYQVPAGDMDNIRQIFNRDFTTAYLEKNPGRDMMSDRRPNNRGVLVGRVQHLNSDHTKAVLKLEKDLHIGDGLEFWVKVGGRTGCTADTLLVNGRPVEKAEQGTLVEISVPKGVRLNDRVFRTLDSELMAYAGYFYGEKNKKRIPVNVQVTARLGEVLEVLLSDPEGHTGKGTTGFIAEQALRHPLDEAAVRKQVDRLGATEYCLQELVLQIDKGIMVPMSEINEARRKACAALDKARLEDFAPPRIPVRNRRQLADGLFRGEDLPTVKEEKKPVQIAVWADTPDKVEAALDGGADWIIFGGDRYSSKDVTFADYARAAAMVRKAGRRIAFSTSRIVKEEQLGYFKKLLKEAENCGIDLLCVHNLGIWQLAAETGFSIPLWADMSLNIYNTQSLAFWQEAGAVGATPSIELNMGQLELLAKTSPLPLECLVQGPIEMMVSEYCVGGSFLGDIGKAGTGSCNFKCREELYLHDRKDADFRLAGDQFCRMHVLNSQDLSVLGGLNQLKAMGIARFRIDGRAYGSDRLKELTALYKRSLADGDAAMENLPGTTRGHYYRGVL